MVRASRHQRRTTIALVVFLWLLTSGFLLLMLWPWRPATFLKCWHLSALMPPHAGRMGNTHRVGPRTPGTMPIIALRYRSRFPGEFQCQTKT